MLNLIWFKNVTYPLSANRFSRRQKTKGGNFGNRNFLSGKGLEWGQEPSKTILVLYNQ